MGTDGSVSWMFHKKGTIVYEKSKVTDYDSFFETALDNGADDVNEEGEAYEIVCAPDAFSGLKEALDGLGLEADAAEVGLVPENYQALEADKVDSFTRLIDTLEDNDDVQNVYHNAELPE